MSDEIKGDQITLTVPGGVPLVLTRKGEALEGEVEGHRKTFVKR